ncbi:MAG: 3-dehydroquinate synthase [Pseudomonadota bacterium]
MQTETVSVGLGARRYDIHIGAGLLDQAGALIAPFLPRPRAVIVTDEHVAEAQGPRLLEGLRAAGIEAETIALPPGEQTKSFAELEALTSRLLDLEVERNDLIIALGGGVIGDLVGFAASILRRGCRFAQIPTSLLAQVDSAVGGKTAINTPQGKNLIGAFYQPSIVIADIDVLNTLPPRHVAAGYAEILKYGLIGDAAFYDWLEENGAALLDGDAAARIHAVKVSCETKARVVVEDETERGARALLNLGHTFGHALEAAYGYSDRLLHGEGVAAGMGLAFDYAASTQMCAGADADRVKAHLRKVGLPADIQDLPEPENLNGEHLAQLMMQDKKVEQGALTLILPEKIGAAKICRDAPIASVRAFLTDKTRSGKA